MDGDIQQLQQNVDDARAAYFVERAKVQALLDPLFRDPIDPGNAVIGIAEEFGAEAALADLEEPARFGPLAEGVRGIEGEARQALAAQIERLLEVRDRLDVATAAREDYLQSKNPNHLRRVHFDGYELVVDGYYGELRGVPVSTERYPAPELMAAQNPSLTEQVGKDVPHAQPTPERDRTRGR